MPLMPRQQNLFCLLFVNNSKSINYLDCKICIVQFFALTLRTTKKPIVMTRNITITNPSPKMIQVFEALRKKKQQQTKKLVEKKDGTFSITV